MASKTFRFPFDKSKSVLQSFIKNEESQYEAFQSVLANIMSAHFPPLTTRADVSVMTPYEFLCYTNKIPLQATSSCPEGYTGIIFEEAEVTHYKSCKNGKVGNPYDLYQANLTQGFCQMFAFFIYMGDISDFTPVGDQSKIITEDQFWKLVSNTYRCGLKTIDLIMGNAKLFARFQADFNEYMKDDLWRIEKGIKLGTTARRYLEDFRKFTLNDVAYYILDQQLGGIGLEKKNNQVVYNIYVSKLEPTLENIKITRAEYNTLLSITPKSKK
jgi:hypothetical protein